MNTRWLVHCDDCHVPRTQFCVVVYVMGDVFDRFKEQVIQAMRADRVVLDRKDLTRSAVLLPIIDRGGEPHLILTRRTMTVAAHKGQVALPGGAVEPEDRDIAETALREAMEEIGLEPNLVEVVGLLDDSVTTTGYVITPVVGFASREAELTPDSREVAEVFEASFSTLLNPANHMMQVVENRGVRFKDHRYFVGDYVIWGATGRIISGFLSLLRR